MSDLYRDRWIRCTPEGIEIRGYYFPWGTRHIAYGSIRSLRRVNLGTFRGSGRIWGTANPRYWASLDPQRPSKQVGLILDLGRFVAPYVTPEDPDAVETVIRRHSHVAAGDDGRAAPII